MKKVVVCVAVVLLIIAATTGVGCSHRIEDKNSEVLSFSNTPIEELTDGQLYEAVNFYIRGTNDALTVYQAIIRANMAQVYQNEILIRSID